MEEIEYLEEYEDLVLPALNSAAAASASSTLSSTSQQIPSITNQKTIANDDDDGSSSSLDQDIFNCLFEDNSDDEKSEDNFAAVTRKSESRASVDSLDLLVNDLDEQVAKEIALKNAQEEQKNKINSSLKAATKIISSSSSSTPNQTKTFMSKNSGTTITINRNTSKTTKSITTNQPTTLTNKKFVATVRPTIQNPKQQQQAKKNTNIIQSSSFTQQPPKSTSFTGTTTITAAASSSSSSSVKPSTSRLIQLPVLARKPLSSTLSSTTSATTTFDDQNLTSNPTLKPTAVKQVIKRPATIVKPEKVITKDPTEDPLNLDDISEAASDNYSVSDISGDTYNSVSNFEDDDDDEDEDDYFNEEQLNEDDDFSSNSQIIEISLDSSGSHSNLEVLRASTPSPIMSRDKPSSSSGFDKWKYQSTKLFANHNIVRGLLTRGEKPKLLDLIKKYDTFRDSSDEEDNDNDIIDITNSRENLGHKSHVNTKETSDKFSSFKNPRTPSNKDNCKTNKISQVTAKTKTNKRESKSPGAASNDSYLSAVEELLEESYAEAMKKIKRTGPSLNHPEVEIRVEGQEQQQPHNPKNTQTGIVIEYEEEELKEKKTEELENNTAEIKETTSNELNKSQEIKEIINELNKPAQIEEPSNEVKNAEEMKESETEINKPKENEEENVKGINENITDINNPTEIKEIPTEIKENSPESNKTEPGATPAPTTTNKIELKETESTETTTDKPIEKIPNDLENEIITPTSDTGQESKNVKKLLDDSNDTAIQSPNQRKKKRFRNLISPEPSQTNEVAAATQIVEEPIEDVGDFKGFEDEASTDPPNETETMDEKAKSSDEEPPKVICSSGSSFKSPTKSLDKHKDAKSSRDSSVEKGSRDIKDNSSKDGDKRDKTSKDGDKKLQTSKDGDKKDQTSKDGDKKLQTSKDGDKKLENFKDGDKKLQTSKEGDKKDQTSKDGDKKLQTSKDGDKKCETSKDVDKKDQTSKEKTSSEPLKDRTSRESSKDRSNHKDGDKKWQTSKDGDKKLQTSKDGDKKLQTSKDGDKKDQTSKDGDKKDQTSKDGDKKEKSSSEPLKDRTSRESSKDRSNRLLGDTKTPHDKHKSHSTHTKGLSKESSAKHHSHHKDHRKSIDSKESSKSRESSRSRDIKETKKKIEDNKDNKQADSNTSKHNKSLTKDLKTSATNKEITKKSTEESKDKTDLNKTKESLKDKMDLNKTKDSVKDKKPENKDQGNKTTTSSASTTNAPKQVTDKKDSNNSRDLSKERKDNSKSKDLADVSHHHKHAKDSQDTQAAVNESREHKDNKKQSKDLTTQKKQSPPIQTTTTSTPIKKIDAKEPNKPSTSKNVLNTSVNKNKDSKVPENPKDLVKGAVGATPQKVANKPKESKDIKGDIKESKDKPISPTKQPPTQTLTKTTNISKESKPMATKITDKTPTKDNKDKMKLQEQQQKTATNTAAKTGTPKMGTPKTGTPKTGTPKTGTPKTGTPQTGTPKKESGNVKQVTSTNNTGTPKTGTPKTGTPITGTPKTGTPKKESVTGNVKQVTNTNKTKAPEPESKELKTEKVNVTKTITTLQKDTKEEDAIETTEISEKPFTMKKFAPIKLNRIADIKAREQQKTLDNKKNQETNKDETEKNIKPELNTNLKLETTKSTKEVANAEEISQKVTKTTTAEIKADAIKSKEPEIVKAPPQVVLMQETKIDKRKIQLKKGDLEKETEETKPQAIKKVLDTNEMKTDESAKLKSKTEEKKLPTIEKQEEIKTNESKNTKLEKPKNQVSKDVVEKTIEDTKIEALQSTIIDTNTKDEEMEAAKSPNTKKATEIQEGTLETQSTDKPKTDASDEILEDTNETEEIKPEPRKTRNRDNVKPQENNSKVTTTQMVENKEVASIKETTEKTENILSKEPPATTTTSNETEEETTVATKSDEIEKTSDDLKDENTDEPEEIKPATRRTRKSVTLKAQEQKTKETNTELVEKKEEETLIETVNTTNTSVDLKKGDLISKQPPTTSNETDEGEKTSDETEAIKPATRRTRKRENLTAQEQKSKEPTTQVAENKEEETLKETDKTKPSSDDLIKGDLISKETPTTTNETDEGEKTSDETENNKPGPKRTRKRENLKVQEQKSKEATTKVAEKKEEETLQGTDKTKTSSGDLISKSNETDEGEKTSDETENNKPGPKRTRKRENLKAQEQKSKEPTTQVVEKKEEEILKETDKTKTSSGGDLIKGNLISKDPTTTPNETDEGEKTSDETEEIKPATRRTRRKNSLMAQEQISKETTTEEAEKKEEESLKVTGETKTSSGDLVSKTNETDEGEKTSDETEEIKLATRRTRKQNSLKAQEQISKQTTTQVAEKKEQESLKETDKTKTSCDDLIKGDLIPKDPPTTTNQTDEGEKTSDETEDYKPGPKRTRKRENLKAQEQKSKETTTEVAEKKEEESIKETEKIKISSGDLIYKSNETDEGEKTSDETEEIKLATRRTRKQDSLKAQEHKSKEPNTQVAEKQEEETLKETVNTTKTSGDLMKGDLVSKQPPTTSNETDESEKTSDETEEIKPAIKRTRKKENFKAPEQKSKDPTTQVAEKKDEETLKETDKTKTSSGGDLIKGNLISKEPPTTTNESDEGEKTSDETDDNKPEPKRTRKRENLKAQEQKSKETTTEVTEKKGEESLKETEKTKTNSGDLISEDLISKEPPTKSNETDEGEKTSDETEDNKPGPKRTRNKNKLKAQEQITKEIATEVAENKEEVSSGDLIKGDLISKEPPTKSNETGETNLATKSDVSEKTSDETEEIKLAPRRTRKSDNLKAQEHKSAETITEVAEKKEEESLKETDKTLTSGVLISKDLMSKETDETTPATKSDESEKTSDETEDLKPQPQRKTRKRVNLKAQELKPKETTTVLAEKKEDIKRPKLTDDSISEDLISKEPTTTSSACDEIADDSEKTSDEATRRTRNRDNHLKAQEHKSKETTAELAANKDVESLKETEKTKPSSGDLISNEPKSTHETDVTNLATKSDESEKTSDETDEIKAATRRKINKSKETTAELAANKDEESLKETEKTKPSSGNLISDSEDIISHKPSTSNESTETNLEIIPDKTVEKKLDLVKTINQTDQIKVDNKEKEPKHNEQTEPNSSVPLEAQETKGEASKISQNIIPPEEAVTNPDKATPGVNVLDNKEPETLAESLENKEDKTQETTIEASSPAKDNTDNPLHNINNNLDSTLDTENNTFDTEITDSPTDTSFRRTLRKRGTDSPFPENDVSRKLFKDPLAKSAMGTPKSAKCEALVTDVSSTAALKRRLPASETEIQSIAKKPKLDGPARKSARYRNFNDDCLEEEELPMVTEDESYIEMSPHVQEAAAQSPRKSIRRTDTVQTKNVESIKEPPRKIQRVEITETNKTPIVVNKETTLNPYSIASMKVEQPPKKLLRREVLDFGAPDSTTIQSSTAETTNITTTKLNISAGRKVVRPEDIKSPKGLQKPVSNVKAKTVASTIEKTNNPVSPDRSNTSKVNTSPNKSPGFSAVLSFADWLKNKNQSKLMAQQQTTGTHASLKEDQTRRNRVRENNPSTAKEMKAPITNPKESPQVSIIKKQDTHLPAGNLETKLVNKSTQGTAKLSAISKDTTGTSADLNKTSTTQKEQTLTASNEHEQSQLEDNSLLHPAVNQLKESNKMPTRRPSLSINKPQRNVKRLNKSHPKVIKQLTETQQQSPKPTITDYETGDKIDTGHQTTTVETHSEMEKTIHTPKHKAKKSEIDVLIESMSKEMKEGGIQDLLSVNKHVKRQRLASKKKATARQLQLNASANESMTTSVEASLPSATPSLRGRPPTVVKSDIVETPSSNDNITKSPHKRQAAAAAATQQNVAKTRKSLPTIKDGLRKNVDVLRKDVSSALNDSAPAGQLANDLTPARDDATTTTTTETTSKRPTKFLRNSLKNKEKDIPNQLQATSAQLAPAVVAEPNIKTRKSLLVNKEATATKEVIKVAGESGTNATVVLAAKPVVSMKSRKSIKQPINETPKQQQQQQQQLPLNKNNRYINKVNTNVFKTPKPITHSTILNTIPTNEDITQLYAVKRPQNLQKNKQPKQPPFKCRKLKVRLNRSLVSRYWKTLKQTELVTSVITTLTEATEKAGTGTGTDDIIQNNETETELRIQSVVSRAGLLSSPTLISSEELIETPVLTPQQLEPTPTTPAELLTAELPTAELPSAELPTAELPTAELPLAELATAELPPAELPTAIESPPCLPPTSEAYIVPTIPIATVPLDTVVQVELKNEFMDENPNSLENAILPDTPTLLARAQSVTQAAQHALSNSVTPTDIRLLTTEAASNTHVPSFGVTPTQLDNRGTCMYTFLHPAKYNRNHSNVLLDYCCPNLDGPMPAIDPTRIHAQVQTRVIELPACIVLTTKVVTRADLESNKSSVPAIIRKKAERIRSNIQAHHHNAAAAAAAVPNPLTQPIQPTQPMQPTQPAPVPAPPQQQQQPVVASVMPPAPPQQLPSTVNALTRHLPSTTTITPKIRSPQPTSSVVHPPPTVSVVSKGVPQNSNMLKNYVQPLRSNLRRFDVLLKQLVKPFDGLTFVDRHRIIESIITSGKLSPRDLERSLVLMEEYLTNISMLQTQQTGNLSAISGATPQDDVVSNLPMQMPQLQPGPNVLAASSSSSSSSTFVTATKQLEKMQNKSERSVQTTKKNTSLTTSRRAVGAGGTGGAGEVVKQHVPIYDTDRNIIGYQLQMVAPLSTMPAYTKSTMSSSLTGSGIMSTSLENQITSYSVRKMPAQESPRVFYTTPPLQTSTPKGPNFSHLYTTTTNPQNTKAVAQKTQKGSVVTVRSGASSGSSETITTTTMATVKRVTRSTATGSKIIIVSKSNQSSEETILPDGNNQQAAEIKNETDMEDFIG